MLTIKRSNLLIIGGGLLQQFTLHECGAMELGKIIVDGDSNCYCKKSPYFNRDYFIEANISQPKLVLEKTREFLRKNKKVKIVGVYTQGCDREDTVAYVARRLGLPHIKESSAQNCHNKIRTRLIFDKYHIPQPRFYIAKNEKDIRFSHCVVKPVDNSASRGLTIVKKRGNFKKAFKLALDNSIDKRVLVDEFIEGNEYSVDTLVYKNKLYPCGISDRSFIRKDNYAIQDGSITPSSLPHDYQEVIYGLMEKAAQVLGINNSAFKGDILIGKDGNINILEVTARLSGGFDSQVRKPFSFGVNLIKATIDLALGKELDFQDIIPKFVKYTKTFTIFPKPGVIKKIIGEKEVLNFPGVVGFYLTKREGDVVSDYRNCSDRVVHITIAGDTLELLGELEKKIRKTFRIIT